MIIFRRRGTAQMAGAFGVLVMAMPSFGAWADTTVYVIFGEARSLESAIEVKDLSVKIEASDLSRTVEVSVMETPNG